MMKTREERRRDNDPTSKGGGNCGERTEGNESEAEGEGEGRRGERAKGSKEV